MNERELAVTRRYHFPVLYLDATRRCNLKCPLCMTGSNDQALVSRSLADELTFDEIVARVLEPALALGSRQLQLGGGEFLMREDALDILSAAVNLGYQPRVLTNGILLTAETARTLKQIAGETLIIVLGINSINDEMMNRKTRDAELAITLNAMDLCRSLSIRRHVVVNVGRHNCRDLEPTFQWLDDRGISFNRSPFVGRNSGGAHFASYGFSRDDMQRHIHPALRKRTSAAISYTPYFLSPELHAELSGGQSVNVTVPQNPQIGCWIGSWIAVGAEGNVSPCVTLLDEVTAGNVRDRSLTRIVDESDIFQRLLDRDRLGGKCGRCRYRCTCGGCRSIAYYHTGDYMAEDPTCFFEPQDEHTVCEHEEETNAVFRRYARMARFSGIALPRRKA